VIFTNLQVVLPLNNIKKNIRFFPLTEKNFEFVIEDPLVTVIKRGKNYVIYRAYKKLATLYPQYFESNCKIDNVKFIIDNKKIYIQIPAFVKVKKNFKVLATDNIRVNVIGFSKKGIANENNLEIIKKSAKKDTL